MSLDIPYRFENKRKFKDKICINLKMENDTIIAAHLSAGGVGPVPAYLPKSSAYLEGKSINEKIIDEVIAIAKKEISPISDARGTAVYKSFLLGQLIRAHFIMLFPEIKMKDFVI